MVRTSTNRNDALTLWYSACLSALIVPIVPKPTYSCAYALVVMAQKNSNGITDFTHRSPCAAPLATSTGTAIAYAERRACSNGLFIPFLAAGRA